MLNIWEIINKGGNEPGLVSKLLRESVESGKNADAQSDYDQYLRDLVKRGLNGDLEGGHSPEGGHEPGVTPGSEYDPGFIPKGEYTPGSEYDPGFIPSNEKDAMAATIFKALQGDTNGDLGGDTNGGLGGDHHDPVPDVAGRVLNSDPENGYDSEGGYDPGYAPEGGYDPGYDPEGGYDHGSII